MFFRIFLLTTEPCCDIIIMLSNMVGVAQSIRAPGCGPGGSGFDSHRSPHKKRTVKTCFNSPFAFRGMLKKFGPDFFSIPFLAIDKGAALCYNHHVILRGRVKFPTGGKVRERISAESVQFRYRQLQSG